MKRRWIPALVAVAAVIAGYSGGRTYHPSEAIFPVQGVDVSHHQGRINWEKVRASGASFAYIKATEGGDHRDRLFASNWRGAGNAGLKRGAYHFFTLCRSGVDQARNFTTVVPREARALPPAVDLEFLGNCKARPDRFKFLAELELFLAAIEQHSGQPAILYLTEEFDRAYDVSSEIQRPLWLRSLLVEPRFGARPWTIWQVHNYRSVNGIAGPADWNVMRTSNRKESR